MPVGRAGVGGPGEAAGGRASVWPGPRPVAPAPLSSEYTKRTTPNLSHKMDFFQTTTSE